MPSPRFNSGAGRAAAKRSGAARKRLSLSDVEEALGSLETEQDAKRRLERLGVWLAAGLISGSCGSGAVRATEVWLKAHSEQFDRERLRAAEKRVKDLEKELAASRRSGLGIA